MKGLCSVLALFCLLVSLGTAEVVVLHGSTFDSVISEGIWFIDYYAPWCGYCKILAPIWEDVSNRYTEVHFAKMDCTVEENKPICHRYGVHSYPTLKIYHKGTYLQDYSGHRTVEAFITYSQSFVKHYATLPTPQPTEEPSEEIPAEVPIVGEVEQAQQETQQVPQEQDGEKVAPPSRKPARQVKAPYISSKEGKVVILTDQNYEKETKEGFWFLKFYAPWCGHCKKLAPTWDELALALKGKVNIGKVDCDAESVCDNYGISSYPTLKFLIDGHMHDYRDKRSLDTLINFSKRMSGEPLVEIDNQAYQKLRKEKDLFFLFLHSEGADLQLFEELSKKFMSISNFFVSSDPALISVLGIKNVPTLLVSQNAEVSLFKGDLTSKTMVEKWMLEHKYPLFAELDSSNAGELLESEDIVVMLVADPAQPEFLQRAKPEMIKAAVQYSREIKQGIQRSKVHFVWLNGALWENYVTKNYEVTRADFPAVFVMRPSLNLYFDTRLNGEKVKVESKDILSLVRDVEKEKVQGKSIGGFMRGIFAGMQRQAKPLLTWIASNAILVIVGVVIFTIALTWFLVSGSPSEKMEKAE